MEDCVHDKDVLWQFKLVQFLMIGPFLSLTLFWSALFFAVSQEVDVLSQRPATAAIAGATGRALETKISALYQQVEVEGASSVRQR